MRKKTLVLSLLLACATAFGQSSYDLVIVGQLVPHYHGMGLVDYPELLSYTPSLHENLVVVGGVAFCVMLFLMGEKLFRGHVAQEH